MFLYVHLNSPILENEIHHTARQFFLPVVGDVVTERVVAALASRSKLRALLWHALLFLLWPRLAVLLDVDGGLVEARPVQSTDTYSTRAAWPLQRAAVPVRQATATSGRHPCREPQRSGVSEMRPQ